MIGKFVLGLSIAVLMVTSFVADVLDEQFHNSLAARGFTTPRAGYPDAITVKGGSVFVSSAEWQHVHHLLYAALATFIVAVLLAGLYRKLYAKGSKRQAVRKAL